jgi:hypothetical protein
MTVQLYSQWQLDMNPQPRDDESSVLPLCYYQGILAHGLKLSQGFTLFAKVNNAYDFVVLRQACFVILLGPVL